MKIKNKKFKKYIVIDFENKDIWDFDKKKDAINHIDEYGLDEETVAVILSKKAELLPCIREEQVLILD